MSKNRAVAARAQACQARIRARSCRPESAFGPLDWGLPAQVGLCGGAVRTTLIHIHPPLPEARMKLTRKIIVAILIGLSLFAAASAISVATHSGAATMVEYA